MFSGRTISCTLAMPRAQPVFRRRHDGAAKPSLLIGIDRQVVDPAAVAVVPDHDAGD